MEFGPRALGARSILADPREPGMRDRVNTLVKKREAFRPFAPAVLEEEAAAYFDISVPSPFMSLTCQVRASGLPAITHVDGSARVQTVSPRPIRCFTRCLPPSATGPLSGPAQYLLHVRSEPIVCSPADAVASFLKSGLDCLVIEDFLLDRRDIPAVLLEQFKSADTGSAGYSHLSYTLF